MRKRHARRDVIRRSLKAAKEQREEARQWWTKDLGPADKRSIIEAGRPFRRDIRRYEFPEDYEAAAKDIGYARGILEDAAQKGDIGAAVEAAEIYLELGREIRGKPLQNLKKAYENASPHALETLREEAYWDRNKNVRRILKLLGDTKHPQGGLESKTSGVATVIIATIGIIGGLVFLSTNITGNVVGNLIRSDTNIVGILMLVLGLIAGFWAFRRRKPQLKSKAKKAKKKR